MTLPQSYEHPVIKLTLPIQFVDTDAAKTDGWKWIDLAGNKPRIQQVTQQIERFEVGEATRYSSFYSLNNLRVHDPTASPQDIQFGRSTVLKLEITGWIRTTQPFRIIIMHVPTQFTGAEDVEPAIRQVALAETLDPYFTNGPDGYKYPVMNSYIPSEKSKTLDPRAYLYSSDHSADDQINVSFPESNLRLEAPWRTGHGWGADIVIGFLFSEPINTADTQPRIGINVQYIEGWNPSLRIPEEMIDRTGPLTKVKKLIPKKGAKREYELQLQSPEAEHWKDGYWWPYPYERFRSLVEASAWLDDPYKDWDSLRGRVKLPRYPTAGKWDDDGHKNLTVGVRGKPIEFQRGGRLAIQGQKSRKRKATTAAPKPTTRKRFVAKTKKTILVELAKALELLESQKRKVDIAEGVLTQMRQAAQAPTYPRPMTVAPAIPTPVSVPTAVPTAIPQQVTLAPIVQQQQEIPTAILRQMEQSIQQSALVPLPFGEETALVPRPLPPTLEPIQEIATETIEMQLETRRLTQAAERIARQRR